jgi:hypothetical protein
MGATFGRARRGRSSDAVGSSAVSKEHASKTRQLASKGRTQGRAADRGKLRTKGQKVHAPCATAKFYHKLTCPLEDQAVQPAALPDK